MGVTRHFVHFVMSNEVWNAFIGFDFGTQLGRICIITLVEWYESAPHI